MQKYLLILGLAFILAGCGGGGDDSDAETANAVQLDPTPTPTLPFEERITNTVGTVNNPFQMVFKPVDTLDERLGQMLLDMDIDADAIVPSAALRDDLGLRDDLANLDAYLQAYFGVNIRTYEVETLQTVAELSAWLPQRIGVEVSRVIAERSGGVYVDVILVDSHGEALTALCESGSGLVSFAWLHGPSTLAADAQNCGQPFMQVLVAENSPLVQFADAPQLTVEATAEVPVAETTPEAEVTAESTAEATPELTAEATAEPTSAPEPTAVPSPTPVPLELGDLQTGDPGQLLLNRDLGTSDLAVLTTRAFCRLSVTDFYSWFVPSVLLNEVGVSPETILELPDREALIDALEDGTCAGTGLSRDQLAQLGGAGAYDNVRVVTTTEPLTYGVLVYPLEVDTGVRLNLNDVFAELGNDPEDGRYLKLLLGQDAIAPLEDDTLDDVRDFFDGTGYDFALLGE